MPFHIDREDARLAAPQVVAPRPGRFRLIRRGLAFLAVFYVAWCGALYVYQDKLLFPRDLAPEPLPGLYDETTIEMCIDTEEGQSLAFFIPAVGSSPTKPAPLVIFFHGNAELIDYQATILEGYRKLGCSVLLPEYRGYGRSHGTPSEKAIVADAVRFYDEIVKRPNVDKDRIVIHGRSLGGGPAAQLAVRRKPQALILESTFTSVAVMAHGYLAPSFLARHPFRTDRVLETLAVPVLIFHGTRDDIVPVSHGRELRDIARMTGLAESTYVEYGCKHNDFPGEGNDAAYWGEITGFLKRSGVLEGAGRSQDRKQSRARKEAVPPISDGPAESRGHRSLTVAALFKQGAPRAESDVAVALLKGAGR